MSVPEGLSYPWLKRELGAAFDKGLRYFRNGRVELLDSDVEHADGLVTGDSVYRTSVRVVGKGPTMRLGGGCTCPVNGQCKHMAALALAWIESARPGQGLQPYRRDTERATRRATYDPWRAWDGVAPPALPRIARTTAANPAQLLYLLREHVDEPALLVLPVRTRTLKSGRLGAGTPIALHQETPLRQLQQFEARDRDLLLRLGTGYAFFDGKADWKIVPDDAAPLLLAVAAEGRVRWRTTNGPALQPADPRPIDVAWSIDDDGTQTLVARPATGGGVVLGTRWQWCVDPDAGTIAPTDGGALAPHLAELAALPSIAPEHVASALAALKRRGLAGLLPAPVPMAGDVRRARSLRAHVTLERPAHDSGPDRLRHGVDALVEIDYDGLRVRPDDPRPELRRRVGDRVEIIEREEGFEKIVGQFLSREGFRPDVDPWERPSGRSALQDHEWHRPGALAGPAIEAWLRGFIERARGFDIDVATGATFPVFHGVVFDQAEVELEDAAGGDWFALKLGVLVDGQRVDILPILLAALADPRATLQHGLRITLPDGRQGLVPSSRLGAILALVADLEKRGDTHGVPRERLAAVVPPPDWRFFPSAKAREFLAELERFEGVGDVEPPASLRANLRPYQRAGLAWLDFLRRFRFGGVLADDMGLGKTVQVLGHLAREKEAGRLAQPSLVVCPTSVGPNWIAEAHRFVPDLRVALLAAGDRTGLLSSLGSHDLVVTSYALMLRDIDALAAQDWSLVVLDEAQWLKNRASRSYKAAVRLKAPMRLCLTGTPVENHLGELKAQFDLVMPGLLGDDRTFLQRFRGPIENARDASAAERLRKRLRPFLLRRTKTAVAAELPPRTLIPQTIELEATQRDLYETLRVQMEKRVREALIARGIARSHITVLDALLKLRQVCCDPRLVDLAVARDTKGSAKREALMDLLPTLVEDGRSVLVFSQFTSMLDLIEADLVERGLPFVRLDGTTRDRSVPVERFQKGEVPVFLISLKAGGVGLNLTRADTVILYDPWWNPAVEAQAIDRAHRIGQDKPVFVYELVCSGTVEEKMRELKSKKRAIADAVLTTGESALEALSAEELLALFSAA